MKENIKAKQLDDRLKNRQKRNLIRNAVINGFSPNPSDANEYLKGLFSVYESVKSKEKAKKLKKHNLVMLGRGWVKAGFDFGTFSERNFRYDQDRNSIYFIGFKPQILSATINPWFVPEKGIEGFEFLIVERRVKRDYKVVQQVKQRCLDELVRKAHEREILLKSVENARESLKEFFSLLIGEEVQNVVFYDNELDFTYSEIIKNDTITGEELLLIDHVLNKQELQGIDPEDLVQEKSVFIDSLRQTKARLVIFNGQEYPRWSPELTVAYAVSRDGTYDEIEDGQMIVNFATRYCSLDTLIEAFQYTCTNQIDNNQLIIDNTNFFIARNTAAMIAVDGAYNKSLDSLFTTDNFFAGLSAAKSDNPDAYRKLISDNIITACKRCENN
jgi:hypothetical protein